MGSLHCGLGIPAGVFHLNLTGGPRLNGSIPPTPPHPTLSGRFLILLLSTSWEGKTQETNRH